MTKAISFYDPYGRTRLSGRKALLFCAYHGFSMPHDTVAAILYNEVLRGAGQVSFDGNCLKLFTPSLTSFVEDVDWLLKAVESMGYRDISDEFRRLDGTVRSAIRERFASEPYNTHAVSEILEKALPAKYLPPKKKPITQKHD